MSTRHVPKIILLGIVLLCAIAFSQPQFSKTNPMGDMPSFETIPHEYLHATENGDDAAMLAEQYGLIVQQTRSHFSIFLADESHDPDTLLAAGFSYNSLSETSAPPWKTTEDPYLDQQYGLQLTRTIEAWTLQGTNTIRVAIIDSGIDIDHAEFQGKISALSYNATSGLVGIANVQDDIGHGTMVAGIIGAIRDNSKGIAGISAMVDLLVIKANNPGEKSFADSAIVDGIYYAIEQGARVINLSLGGTYANPLTEQAIAFAKASGVLVVAASGNDGTDTLMYPASFSESISVSSVGPNGLLSEFSNYGIEVDLAAPGEGIITTAMNNGYATVDGTSFSAPHVSGILALFLSKYPEVEIEEALARVTMTAYDLGLSGRDDIYGYGIVDAYRLLADDFVKITFETFSGSTVDSIWIVKDSLFNVSSIPVLPDHVFIGWCLDPELTIPWNSDTDRATSDLTLYAKYTSAFHTVSFVTEGTLVEPLIVMHGDTFVLPSTTRPEYHFSGWYTTTEYTIPYIENPVETDLVLYAKFDPIIYYTVTLHRPDQTNEIFALEAGTVFEPGVLMCEGLIFIDWYQDPELSILYVPGELIENLDLYAKTEPVMLAVTMNIPEHEPIVQEFPYGTKPDLPIIEVTGSQFAGWFLDMDFTSPYYCDVIKADLTLYGRYAAIVHDVTLVISPDDIQHVYVLGGEQFQVTDPEMTGYDFTGWSLDAAGEVPYINTEITEDLVLYAQFSQQELTVSFFDFDKMTVIKTETILYGGSAVPPASPQKPSTPALDYEFSGWSDELTEITQDMMIYPRYQATVIAGMIHLSPGIDTIMIGDSWMDAGVQCPDSALVIFPYQTVEPLIAGKYNVRYEFRYEDMVVYELIRVVHVIDKAVPDVRITLNPGITTIHVGEIYVDGGATANIGTIETIGSVDTSKAGSYILIYRVVISGYEFSKSRVVYVLDNHPSLSLGIVWPGRKETDEEI